MGTTVIIILVILAILDIVIVGLGFAKKKKKEEVVNRVDKNDGSTYPKTIESHDITKFSFRCSFARYDKKKPCDSFEVEVDKDFTIEEEVFENKKEQVLDQISEMTESNKSEKEEVPVENANSEGQHIMEEYKVQKEPVHDKNEEIVGNCTLKIKFSTGKMQEDSFKVSSAAFREILRLIRKYDLAQYNGCTSYKHGMVEDNGGTLNIYYASGESICTSDNDDLPFKWITAIDIYMMAVKWSEKYREK